MLKSISMSFFVGDAMFGLIAYILASLLIYYVAVGWPWIVFGAAASLALFAGGSLLVQHRRLCEF